MPNEFVLEAKRRELAEKSRNLRYKKPALASLGWEAMQGELWEIEEGVSDVHWFMEGEEDNILAAMDGDEEEVYEFKMAFADLEAKTDRIRAAIDENDPQEYFDDCTVALIGNRYEVVGFDSYEEDYFSLCRYEADLAASEAGKRISRWTKSELIANIGHCLGIELAFLDLRQQYDYLKATMDMIRGENLSILKVVKEIERAYDRAADNVWRTDGEFERLLKNLPDRVWLE